MKAYELLAKPDKWTTGASARDGAGNEVATIHPDACAFCTIGALAKCYKDFDYSDKTRRLRTRVGPVLHRWNDNSTYEEVIAVLKELDI
jgi:hypothetical protein